jgi:TPR repeat protein
MNKNKTHRRVALAWLAAGMLGAGGAAAAPADDNALAEKEFARGDLIASLALWRKAADQGYAPAQARLGDIMDKSEEDEEAVAWYGKAAAQGNAAGQYGLGQMYAKGEGVKPDPAKAFDLIMQAARQDHGLAAVMLMESYRAGRLGLKPDPVQAAAWEARAKTIIPGYKANLPRPKAKGKAK